MANVSNGWLRELALHADATQCPRCRRVSVVRDHRYTYCLSCAYEPGDRIDRLAWRPYTQPAARARGH